MGRPILTFLALAGIILGSPLADACAQPQDERRRQDRPAERERPSRASRSSAASGRHQDPPSEQTHPIGKVIEPDTPRDALRKIMMLESLVDDKLELRGDTRREVEDKFERFLVVLREAAGATPSGARADEARDLQRKMRQAHEDRDMDEYRRLRTELSRLMRGPEESETPELAPFLQDLYTDLEPDQARRYVHLLARLDLVEVDEDDDIPLRKFIRLLLAPQVDLSNDQRQSVGSLIKKHKEGLTDPRLTPFERRQAFEQFRDAIYSHLSDQQREMIENRLNPPKRPELPPELEEEDVEIAEREEPRPAESAPTPPESTETTAKAEAQEAGKEPTEETAADTQVEAETRPGESPEEAQPESMEEQPTEAEPAPKEEPESPPEQPVEPAPKEEPVPEPPAPEEREPEPPVREEPPPPEPEKPAPKEEEKPAPVEKPDKPKETPAPKPEKETPPPKQEPKKKEPAPAPPKKPVDRDRPPETKDKPEDSNEQ